MPLKGKDKSKDKTKAKSKSQDKVKGKAAQPKSRAKRTLRKKAKRVSRAPFIFIIMILLGVIAFLLLRQTDMSLPFRTADKRDISMEKSNVVTEKKAKTGETDKTDKVDKTDKIDKADEIDKVDKVDKTDKKSDVQVWFLRLDEKTENIFLVPAKRNVLDDGKIENALKALIEGPSAGEKARGYLTAVPANLKIRDIKIKNRVAEIDFSAAIGEGAGGNILMNRIDQIIYTATQFNGIDGITISINGKRQNVIGGEGLSIQGILSRK